MTCPHCAVAKSNAGYPVYQAACRGCRVRSLASGMAFFASAKAGRITPQYRAALVALAGEDWQAAHAEVKQERARIEALLNQEQQQ